MVAAATLLIGAYRLGPGRSVAPIVFLGTVPLWLLRLAIITNASGSASHATYLARRSGQVSSASRKRRLPPSGRWYSCIESYSGSNRSMRS
jgi:hypothetical protein